MAHFNVYEYIENVILLCCTIGLCLFGMTVGVCMQMSEDREDPGFWIVMLPLSWLFFMLLLYPFQLGPAKGLISMGIGCLYVGVAFAASRRIGRKSKREQSLSESERQYDSAIRDLYE